MFEIRFEVGRFDCEANRHLKNTAFLEYAIEARFRYFNENGFPRALLPSTRSAGGGQDEIIYKRELHLLDKLQVQFLSAGINKAGTRNLIVSRIIKADGGLAAD
jgi:acyl-CoA thioester hydrolase